MHSRKRTIDKHDYFAKAKLALVRSYIKALFFGRQMALSIGVSLKTPARVCKTVPACSCITMQWLCNFDKKKKNMVP